VRQLASRWGTAAVLAVAALAALTTAAGPASGADDPTTWSAPLTPDGDDTNVRSDAGALRLDSLVGAPASVALDRPEGTLLSTVHRLTAPAQQIAIQLDDETPAGSAVAVAVRGLTAGGSWTEWSPVDPRSPATLPAPVSAVQARTVLLSGPGGASPVVRSLRLTAQPGQARSAGAGQSASRQVYATREGLVGRKTANGHVILNRDHFVALPSRRGLSSPGSGDYTVKVCAANGRCEWAPVWDVGPWNTTDDYWNGPGDRESWQDLPPGLPQAQAAYQNGYNNGRDQFGRRVANPSGIDLADGMFWDGLGLRDNSWVTVTYLWNLDGLVGTVTSGMLNVRSGPGTERPSVGLATHNAKVLVECTVGGGGSLFSDAGRTPKWLRIGPNQFVSAAHVSLPASSHPC
jgi:hypothetical protein